MHYARHAKTLLHYRMVRTKITQKKSRALNSSPKKGSPKKKSKARKLAEKQCAKKGGLIEFDKITLPEQDIAARLDYKFSITKCF